MKKEWVVKKVSDNSKTVLEKLLEQRGITKPNDIKEFLNPDEFKVISPYAFCDMKKVIERIKKAVSDKEKFLIYGDFDADGITSTSLLIKTLRHINADVDYFIPEREKHGHGLNLGALFPVITKRKPKLIITVDCGVSNIKEVAMLKAFGIDTIITDHHEAKEEMPECIGIINPKAPYKLDENLSAKEIVSLTSLAGVGVAFKLASALLAEYDENIYILDLLPFVAVGTISDIVPLVYENRLLVKKGLGLISRHYGLSQLIKKIGINLDDGITSEQVAFGVTPRINATGRLDNVENSVKLLISDNPAEIEIAIQSLDNCNKIRQELCENIFQEAKNMPQNNNSIVLFNKEWHIGIIGIVASRLVETFNKPAFLMTYSEETNQIRCSARSVEGVNVFDVLSANADLFDNYGGHAMAGGFSFSLDKHSLEEVQNAISTTIDEILGGENIKPFISVDLELTTDDLDINLVNDIEKLQPFGAENPNPKFVIYDLKLLQKKLMGSEKNHLKLLVSDSFGNTFDCIWWSKGDISLTSGNPLDIVFYPQLNTYNGNTTLQLIISDIHSDFLTDEVPSKYEIFDDRKKTGIFSCVEDYLKKTKYKVGVFAENSHVLEQLKPYPQICNRIFNRLNVVGFDVIMFFDYPPCSEIFREILVKSAVKRIHFMRYEQKDTNEKEYIKTVAGMIKYAVNHYNGNFNIRNASAKLSVTNDAVTETLNALESVGIIEILDRNESSFVLELKNNNFTKILHSELYAQFLTELKMSDDFKSSFSEADLNYLCNIS